MGEENRRRNGMESTMESIPASPVVAAWWRPYAVEVAAWWAVTWPSALRGVAELLPWLCTLLVVGRALGSDALAALSLAEAYGYPLMVVTWGATSATASALVSQAHGARSAVAARGWLVIATSVCLGLSVAVAGLWAAAAPTLTAAGFDGQLAADGARFLVPAIPALLLQGVAVPAGTYLTALQVAALPSLVQAAACALDVGLTVALVLPRAAGGAGLGLAGAAVAWVAASCAEVLLYAAALAWVWGRELTVGTTDAAAPGLDPDGAASKAHSGELVPPPPPPPPPPEPAPPPSVSIDAPLAAASAPLLAADALAPQHPPPGQLQEAAPTAADGRAALVAFLLSRRRWAAFARQAAPNAASSAMDSLMYTAVSFLAAGLGPPHVLAAHNVALCVLELAHAASSGMSEATAVRVGFHLGRRDVHAARRAVAVAVAGAVAWGAVVAGAGLAVGGAPLGRAFSSDDAVVDAVASVAPLLWGSYALLCVGYQVVGALEGAGRAGAQAAVVALGAWGVTVPSAVAVARAAPHTGLPGLWACLLGGYAVVTLAGAGVVATSDWSALADAAAAHIAGDGGGNTDADLEGWPAG